MGNYNSNLSEDIKKVNSKYKDKGRSTLLQFIYSAITVGMFGGILFVCLPIMIKGNVLLGLLYMASFQGIGLFTVNEIDQRFNSKERKLNYDFSKYCAEERVKELSDELQKHDISISYEQIKNASDIDIVSKRRTGLIETKREEEHVIIFDPYKYEYLHQKIDKLRHLRGKIEEYGDLTYNSDEKGKVKQIGQLKS